MVKRGGWHFSVLRLAICIYLAVSFAIDFMNKLCFTKFKKKNDWREESSVSNGLSTPRERQVKTSLLYIFISMELSLFLSFFPYTVFSRARLCIHPLVILFALYPRVEAWIQSPLIWSSLAYIQFKYSELESFLRWNVGQD